MFRVRSALIEASTGGEEGRAALPDLGNSNPVEIEIEMNIEKKNGMNERMMMKLTRLENQLKLMVNMEC